MDVNANKEPLFFSVHDLKDFKTLGIIHLLKNGRHID